jgi:hypothetical protein
LAAPQNVSFMGWLCAVSGFPGRDQTGIRRNPKMLGKSDFPNKTGGIPNQQLINFGKLCRAG